MRNHTHCSQQNGVSGCNDPVVLRNETQGQVQPRFRKIESPLTTP